MRVTKNGITEFSSSNLTESVATWTSGSLYNFEDEAEYNNYIYKYSGTNGTNTTGTPDNEATWIQDRPSNTFAMLDEKPSTYSTAADTIEVSFISKGFDKLALFNVEAKSVTVTVTSIWNASDTKTFQIDLLNTSLITTLRDYCTAELEQKTTVYIEIPIFHNCSVDVVIDNTNSTAKCGQIISGKSFYVGQTDWGIGLGLTSYSKKEVDALGGIDFIKRGISDIDDFTVTIDTSKAIAIKQKMKEYDAQLLLFTIVEGNSKLELMNFGYWEDFYTLLSGPIKSECNMTIQGVY